MKKGEIIAMKNATINREGRDALFRIVFGENKENALALYNAINHSDYRDVDELEITTLEDAVYIGIKNDVSFLFNHDMNLYEHQSTYCPNMPLRGLGYFADLYKIYLGGETVSRSRLYDSRRVVIPAPKYYVFYNGVQQRPETEDLRLSDSYEGEGDIEITAHIINVNAGCSKELKRHCKPLSDYSEFVHRVREYAKEGQPKEEAVEAAIDSCIKDGILEDLLRKERAKVSNALYTALTEEEIEWLRSMQLERAIREGHEQGLKEGIAEGRAETKFEDVEKLTFECSFDMEKACEILGVEIADYKSWKAKRAGKPKV